MPYLREMHLNRLRLVQFSAINLANIVLLYVGDGIDGRPTDVPINLPSLLSLKLGGNSFSALSALKTPSLQKLAIDCPQIHVQTVDGPFIAALRNGFQVSKLLVLILDIYLDGPATLEVLRFFPDITHLSLRWYDTKHAADVLWHVFPGDRRNINLCPSLHFVCYVFDVPPSDEDVWTHSLLCATLIVGSGYALWNRNGPTD